MAFTPDSVTLAIDASTSSVYLWNSITKKITATLTPPENPEQSFAMALAPDGATLADSQFGGNTYLWHIAYHES